MNDINFKTYFIVFFYLVMLVQLKQHIELKFCFPSKSDNNNPVCKM